MALSNVTTYTVQKGDALYKIARNSSTNISDIIKSNPNINPYTLTPGQVLIMPSKTHGSYINSEYNVRFKYPPEWAKIDNNRYEGKSGFFHVSAISSSGSIEDVCKSEACHRLLPYGSRPSIKKVQHLGRKACIILPSEDQATKMNNQAAFIIEYPSKIEIQGEQYNYFLLWASKDHILEIIKTLKFIKV